LGELTLAEVLGVFFKDTDLDVSSVQIKRNNRHEIDLVADLELSVEEQITFVKCFNIIQKRFNRTEKQRLQDRLYQHLGRHPKFGEKLKDHTWIIPRESLKQIAHWAVKSRGETGKKVNKNVMMSRRAVDLLAQLQRGQISPVVDFSVKLFFSVIYGEKQDIKIEADKLRLYARLTGVKDIDERLKQLMEE
jgi:hypothetical protein